MLYWSNLAETSQKHKINTGNICAVPVLLRNFLSSLSIYYVGVNKTGKKLPQRYCLKMSIGYLFYWHRSYRGNLMTLLRFFSCFCFCWYQKSFFRNRLSDLIPLFAASIRARLNNAQTWELSSLKNPVLPPKAFHYRYFESRTLLMFETWTQGPTFIALRSDEIYTSLYVLIWMRYTSL